MNEAEIIEALVTAQAVQQRAEKAIEEHFRPLVTAALAGGDFQEAFKIVGRMPDSVAKVFMLDAIRVARGDYRKT